MEKDTLLKINGIMEHDMDVLFSESFLLDRGFMEIFIETAGKEEYRSYDAESVEISHVDTGLGESDITVILTDGDRRVAFLIENKIDAVHQERQAERYYERGNLGVKNGQYQAFEVFIVAPQKYLDADSEVDLYGHNVSYNTCLDYFKTSSSMRSKVMVSALEQAMSSAGSARNKVVDEEATAFWKQFVEYKNTFYGDLDLRDKVMEKPKGGAWATFGIPSIDRKRYIYIYLKHDRGRVDLNFSGLSEYYTEFKALVDSMLPDREEKHYNLEITGKTISLWHSVDGTLDYQKPFEEQKNIVDAYLRCIKDMVEYVALLDRDKIVDFYTSKGISI